ncbi:MAG: diguanylate cyclase/phosphodiesterase (GGDEF & EAL domains) with PAS/PAC sensor(s) [uncultured Acetobacteraceae bacterium]|uniref:histidine kinase n=1 Tax=uncultured Acetobacteraceae bacterium TaxID=169975 RepID=A0A6J4JDT8_9PROT|nr:MAG: diguanylate cyclase/phosphodiesterase (GGDEF & EAL domains) with PAS/PAC sensor(s) [uncultured Acetobacteraceae bacterium]
MPPSDEVPTSGREVRPPGSHQAVGSEDVFFTAIRQAGLPMVVTDPRQADNPIVFANDAFSQLTGYPAEQVLGRNCRFMQGPKTDSETITSVRRAVGEGGRVTVEMLNYRRDGTPFWNALHVSPVFGSDGEPLYFFGSQFDVTRQRAADAAWHRSQKMEALGQLTSGIAHDFNNLLMVIAGNLELIGKAEDPERRRRLSSRMQEAVFRARQLTRQLLAFARRQQLNHRAIDLNALIATMAEPIRRILGPSIRLETRLDPDLDPCFADAGQVEVALINLLLNARDAMPGDGAVTITTGLARLDEGAPEVAAGEVPPGDYVSLFVTDVGIGMQPEVLDRAIEPFFTTKHSGPGSGLGLSTVHGFAQQSRGHLLLRSQPGQGTSARLLFPCFAVSPAWRPEPDG